jgi:hypothetical protein
LRVAHMGPRKCSPKRGTRMIFGGLASRMDLDIQNPAARHADLQFERRRKGQGQIPAAQPFHGDSGPRGSPPERATSDWAASPRCALHRGQHILLDNGE